MSVLTERIHELSEPKPKLAKRTSTLPNAPIPNQHLSPIPIGAKVPRLAIIGRLSAFLAAAIDLGAGSGTTYAASMTKNADVTVKSSSATALVVESRVSGTVGNFLDTTEALAGGTNGWGATTLASGAGSFETFIDELQAGFQLNAALLSALEAAEL